MAGLSPSIFTTNQINLESISFSMFTPEEVRKFCTIKICTPLVFDSIGHPLPGGLYDNRLGPIRDKGGELCGTCNKNMITCPGHFGYIELPLPVVNPIFHKTLAHILQLSCFSCHKMQVPEHVKQIISVQMKLLDFGMVTEARELEMCVSDIVNGTMKEGDIPEETLKRLKKLRKLVSSIGLTNDNTFLLNKNTESLRLKFLQLLLKNRNSKKSCLHCRGHMPRIQTFRSKLMTTVNKPKGHTEEKVSLANRNKIITPEESRQHVRLLWENDKEILKELLPVLRHIKSEQPTDILFLQIVPVTPPNVRPANYMKGVLVESAQNNLYKQIMHDCILLKTVISIIQGKELDTLPEDTKTVYEFARGATPVEKLHYLWQQLQTDIDCIMDCEMSYSQKISALGLKQIIEKKTGVIRMNMMGKRVNYACRSVITPDPNLNIDEIGIPEAFAKQLTYPMPVSSWNVEEVRKMVMNGPNVHPGATMIEFSDGTKIKIGSKKTQQESILKRLLTPVEGGGGGGGAPNLKIVHRHLCNGDIMLLNRQPTLHRPSIMAHKVRILKGEKTIRLHYANCKAYNADFDGDEMNAHFPQNELARSEGYLLANVCNQYLVPKDGTPLSGLIQDHVVSGVRLSIRGSFFSRCDYQQLVYQALSYKPGQLTLLPPAILKPQALWSGKQVLSTVIINTVPRGRKPLNLTASAKISAKEWQAVRPRPWAAGGTPFRCPAEMSEAEVVIRGGELLCGVLDKMHYGATPYGLVHCMYELYGSVYACRLLSSFAKLFTAYLQQRGFTLGVHDILLQPHADLKRSRIIQECRNIGHVAACRAVDVPEDTPLPVLTEKIEHAYSTNPKFRAIIDKQYKQLLDSYNNDINASCLPAGLLCRFPDNNLQLMVQSGAKGSRVNTMQISCLLGQIELEGKRPPLMISGRTLPSFIPFDVQPRAGGFIDGRFMTGILPQEFFFHCMAGREGLIDTAVKTSRSGYLQRCLVKHLEGLRVGYDLTVRDSDKSVIQFFYGEDGMDISKVQFLNKKQLPFLAENAKVIADQQIIEKLKESEDLTKMKKHIKKIKDWKKKQQSGAKRQRSSPFLRFAASTSEKINVPEPKRRDETTGRTRLALVLNELWATLDADTKQMFMKDFQACPDPVCSAYQPDVYYGSLSEHIESLLENFATKSAATKRELADALKLKAMQSLCAPGEPVGLLAAQSIGEPSTQMTLNTFHFAGRGEMNVTLGIPRLREILMLASANIKTPSMEVPFLKVPDLEKKAERLRRSLTRVTVANVLEKIDVSVVLQTSYTRQYVYKLRFQFLPHHLYKNEYCVVPNQILRAMNKKFFKEMFAAIRKITKVSASSVLLNEVEKQRAFIRAPGSGDSDEQEGRSANDAAEAQDDDSSEEEPEGADEDAKVNARHKDKVEFEEPEDEEVIQSEGDEDGEDETDVGAKRATEEAGEEEVGSDITVLQNYAMAEEYIYDKKDYLWCELTFAMPVSVRNIDLSSILKDVAHKCILWETENIKRAITYQKGNDLVLRTDGINIIEMFKYNELLDLNRLYSNDIHRIADTYGIEAARQVIVKEVKDVFNVYGIVVDPRHLLLIADYMTYNGTFQPLSRKGMESGASPLQQISFESSLTFLRAASVQGKQDCLSSPSSCLMLGKPCPMGTGAFSLMQKIPTLIT